MQSNIVRCPKCGKFRRTTSMKKVKCFSCGAVFDVKKHIISESSYKKSIDKEVKFE
ncbi:MAG: hypothetical protein M1441_00605 [Candidatus Parvarchaeota archaeon]|nr:hypothetical protein [Candidatus Parvarchaeota archaeon]